MKSVLVFCFTFLVIHFHSYSQSAWEYYENDSDNYSLIRFAELNWNENIINVTGINKKINFDEYNRKFLIRLQNVNSGDIIRENVYHIDSLIVELGWIFSIPEIKEYIIVGGAYYERDSIQRGYFLATRWSEDLELLSDTLVRLEPIEKGQHLWHHSGRKLKNEKFIFIGSYCDYGPKGDNIIVQFNRSGEIEIIKYLHHEYGLDFSSSIEEKIDIGGYFQCFGGGKFVLDDELNLVDTLYNIHHFFSKSQAYIKRLDDNYYLVTDTYEGGFNPGIDKIDKELNLIQSYDFGYSTEEWESTLIGKGIDWVDTSSIYVGAHHVYGGRFYSLAQFDSNLNPKWIKYMGLDDGYAYTLYTLLATKDGGCALFGLREEYTGLPAIINPNAWAIKFDAEGNTVSSQKPISAAWSATVYPNPSPGFFRLNIEGSGLESTLKIVDLEGRKVGLYPNLESGENQLDLSYIPSGTYIWQLLKKGELIGSGKWVKE